MKALTARACGLSLLAAAALTGPTMAYAGEPANESAKLCQDQPEFSVGQCLSLTRENSTNELAAACIYFRELGLLGVDPDDEGPADVIRNVGDCIAYLQTIE